MNLPSLRKTMKGYSINQISAVGIVFVVAGIILSFGATILTDLQDDQTADSWAYNITQKALESLQTFGDWLPTLALVVVAAIIIGVLFFYLGRQNR